MRYRDGEILMSARELAESALRGGDLGGRNAVSASRMTLGGELHRNLQAEYAEKYPEFVSEYHIDGRAELCGVKFRIAGSADCFYTDGEVTVVEEIKTVSNKIPREPIAVHLAQLRVYGYFILTQKSLDTVKLRLTYINASDLSRDSFDSYETKESLGAHVEAMLSSVHSMAKQYVYRYETLLPSVREKAVFPFGELRAGQETLITEGYRAIKAGKRLFAQAPTGTGKTLSALYPAVRALAEGHCDRIFYLTAKASTRREAFAAAKRLFDNGAKLRTCTVTARDQCCLCAAARESGRVSSYCNPRDCEYARGYYDRVNFAIVALLERCNGFSRSAIETVAKEFSVCPYEMSLDLSELCDIIICDYNYAFDPAVYFRRYFSENSIGGDNVFLIDEAHNLPDRVRDMYSTSITRSAFESVYISSGKGEPELDAALERIIMFLRGLRRLCRDSLVKAPDGERGFYMTRSRIKGLYEAFHDFAESAESWRKAKREHPLYSAVSDLLYAAKKYMLINDYYDEKFLTYVEILGNDTRVRVFCLDPSGVLGERLAKARSAVLFSATLTPLDYFTELCGASGAFTVDLPSPFDSENLCIAAVDTVSTKKEDRTAGNCRKIAVYIAATVSAEAGNYMCYFPSYDYMEKVLSEFKKKYPDVMTVVQKRGMTYAQKEEFLSSFKNDSGVLRIGFCVLGGSFSEGVDLPGKRLIGSIVVGVGTPGITNERNILRDYYDLVTEQNGYDYAYTYPGMNAVLQAAGRVIRRDDDKGIVVLIDERYGTPAYTRLFPEQWNGMKFAGNPSSLAEIARRFWKKSSK